jgi:hypothetical protein
MANSEIIYSDYSYTVEYKDLQALLERIEELQVLMYDLISFYVVIDTFDYEIIALENNGHIVRFYGKGYIEQDNREVSEPQYNPFM